MWTKLPPTCKGSSRYDTFLLPPSFQHMFQQATILSSCKYFDAHDPVVLTLRADFPLTWRQPQSWVKFQPNMERAEFFYEKYRREVTDAIQHASTTEDAARAFVTWSEAVAIQEEHSLDPLKQPASGLPRAARGRCRARKRQPMQSVAVSRKGRAGDSDLPENRISQIHTPGPSGQTPAVPLPTHG